MNWWQALITILLGNTIVLVPILLNSHPGTQVRHPLPGLRARRLRHASAPTCRPSCARWWPAAGSASRPGSAARRCTRCSPASSPAGPRCWAPASAATPRPSGSRSCSSGALNIFIIYRGMDLLRHVENWAAPFVLVMTAVLLWWAVDKANGLGPLLSQPGQAPHPGRVPARLHPLADRHDRLLGHALAEHARLHALRPQPARADRWARWWPCPPPCPSSRPWAC